MADRIFLRLNARYALGADSLQWIIYRARVSEPSLARSRDWHGVSFVSSTKALLLGLIGGRDGLCPEAQLALDGYPGTFEAWKAEIAGRGAAGAGHPETFAALNASRASNVKDLAAETVLDGPEVALSCS